MRSIRGILSVLVTSAVTVGLIVSIHKEAAPESKSAVFSKHDLSIRSAERNVEVLRAKLDLARAELGKLRRAEHVPSDFEKYRTVSPPEVSIITSGTIVAYGECSDFAVGDKVALLKKNKNGYLNIAVMGVVQDVDPTYVMIVRERPVHGLPELNDEVCLVESTMSQASLYNCLSGKQGESQ